MSDRHVFHIGFGPAIGGAVSLVGALALGAWAVGNALLTDMRDNVSRTQVYIDELRKKDTESTESNHAVEIELRDILAELTSELRVTNKELAGLGINVSSLNANVQGINGALSQSIRRQEDFERWVTVRLGPIGATPTMLPPGEWAAGQEKIFEALAQEVNPLGGWYEALSDGN